MRGLTELERDIGHAFKNPALLQAALTHSSSGAAHNYERLEFLGDRVLGLAVAELLYKTFPEESEGDLAKRLAALVQGSFLAQIAARINLGDYIRFSEAERAAGGAGNAHILADVFEALIGALYLDAGFATCVRLIETLWSGHLDDMPEPPQHPKTALQEWTQARGLSLPVYKITNQSGPDHAPVFEVTLSVPGYPAVQAQGRSRQVAEKEAAELFLSSLQDAP